MNPVDEVIHARKTTKVLAKQPLPANNSFSVLDELVACGGMAPFHRACEDAHRNGTKGLDGIEPWRFHILTSNDCRKLAPSLDPDKAGKIPAMLNAADALVLATWLPNSSSSTLADGQLFDATLGNMEHIAAASAAIQNLLLAATARGIENYWSSGGILRSSPVYDRLGIPQSQILLGALFLFPTETHDAEVVGSKLREKRTTPNSWSRRVVLAE